MPWFGIAITVSVPAHAQTSPFGPNRRVNHAGDGYYQAAPEIAHGLEGNVYVSWEEWRHISGSVYFTRSLDGGQTFEEEFRVDPAALPGYGEPMLVRWPCMAVDGQGIIYVAWVMLELGTTGRLYCARSIDQGLTFEDPVLVSDSEIGDRAWPSLAGDPAGGAYIVWVDFREGDDIISLYTAHTDDGASFRENIKANREPVGPACTPPLPKIAVAAETGLVHLAWRQSINYSIRHVYACRSLDGGLTFELPVAVTEEPWIFDG